MNGPPNTGAMIKEGDVVVTKRTGDRRYRMVNLHNTPFGAQGTIVRETPKVKGKAARKAERKARRERRGVMV